MAALSHLFVICVLLSFCSCNDIKVEEAAKDEGTVKGAINGQVSAFQKCKKTSISSLERRTLKIYFKLHVH